MAVVIKETINLTEAHYLLEHYKYEDFILTFDGKKTDAKKEYDKIVKYLNHKVNAKTNYVNYNYAYKRTNGRLFGENSIQNKNKDIRGFLCQNLTTDIDMVNAHPTILLDLCYKHNINKIELIDLEYYILKRQDALSNIVFDEKCSLEEAKIKVLTSTNSNIKLKTKSSFLERYDKAMKYIQKQFLEIEEFAYVKEYAKKDVNFEGSFINHVLCIHEEIILKAMRNFCSINELELHSLMFDGLMLYGNINKYTLDEMNKYINNNTDFKSIKLAIKEHQTSFTLPLNFKPKERTGYEDLKVNFELTNCKVGHEFVCDKHNDFNVYSDHAFKVLHEELTFINEEGKPTQFITHWFKDPLKRKYDTFDSFPKDSLCPPHVYNMWEKFLVQDMPSVDSETASAGLQWFLNHIDVMTDFNSIHSNFVKMWIAQMFQYPENKSIHLVFVGLEGTGKGTFVKFFETIMGGSHRCWECVDPQEDIFGKFNDQMKKSFLVILNEADKSGTYNANNKMKALITDKTINIRPKGKTAFTMKSYHRFMSFSNNPDPTTKLKRRDFTMRTSDSKINDVVYFTEGNKYAASIECGKAIYDFFMSYNTKPNIVETDIPKGIYDEMLKEAQKEPVVEFLEEFVYIHTGCKYYSSNQLYDLFLDFCKRNHIQFVMSKIAFSTRLGMRKYKGIINQKKWCENRMMNCWCFDIDILKLEVSDDK